MSGLVAYDWPVSLTECKLCGGRAQVMFVDGPRGGYAHLVVECLERKCKATRRTWSAR